MKKKVKVLLSMLVTLTMLASGVLGVSAAQRGDGDRSQLDGRKPISIHLPEISKIVLESSKPEANGLLSTLDKAITLQFSGPIANSKELRGMAIMLIKDTKEKIPVNVSVNDSSKLVITPKEQLLGNATYTLFVAGLKDSKGLMLKPVTLRFKTAADADEVVVSDQSEVDETRDQTVTGNVYKPEHQFKDVNKNFWGYQAIFDLTRRGILNGYSDNTFKPNANVSRAEFATMLTKTLKLTVTDHQQTFVDVPPSSWFYKTVEASKAYLTGYQTADGKMFYYGTRNAVREDMAVALVKALNLTMEKNEGQLQQIFTDYAAISPDLQDYVYTAYKNGIMQGAGDMFNPQGTLTRAEAAQLLERALQKVEKVPVADVANPETEKVVVPAN